MADTLPPSVHRLTTPRAAALAGVLFALVFGAAIILIRISLPEGAEPGSQWLEAGGPKIRLAAELMPFAGICFLWFIGVVRVNLGQLEDRFFSTVAVGSGLLFLAMMFASSAVGAAARKSGISAMAARPAELWRKARRSNGVIGLIAGVLEWATTVGAERSR